MSPFFFWLTVDFHVVVYSVNTILREALEFSDQKAKHFLRCKQFYEKLKYFWFGMVSFVNGVTSSREIKLKKDKNQVIQ